MLQTFTTRAQSRSERSRQWRAVTLAEHVEFEDDRQASFRGGKFGALTLCIVSTGRYRWIQSGRAEQAQGEQLLEFMFQEEGCAVIRQVGHSHALQAGQWCALRRDVPFEIDTLGHSRQLAISVPCSVLPAPRRSIDWWRQPRSFLRGPAQVLHASASACVLTGSSLSDGEREQLGGQLTMMIEMTVRADEVNAAIDVREGRRRAILEHIDRNLADTELGIGSIARAFDISSRTIHKLFEGEAQTAARLIWDRRLERCREEMADPAMASRSITEIAHLWGFSDSQHFSRAFKQRFGVTPRDYRNLFAVH
ncbi:MAG: helix-turn-helix domain-containing protein [Sphingobium sp.]|nr:helix-turn-helix domain-containing protein [Sphingobium sp.]